MVVILWYCTRQRAGPLVKECRALRPRTTGDTAADQAARRELRRAEYGTFERRQVDRLELRLALMGYKGSMHTLTFDPEHLPHDFAGVRRALSAFLRRAQRWRESLEKDPCFDYIYAIEGLHGSRRYHIHLITRDEDFAPSEIAWLWRSGFVDNEPVLKFQGGFRRLAEYLNKERTDGFVIPIGRHPWSCSRTLTSQLAPPERWRDDSGEILVPDNALWVRRGSVSNDFGAYAYASWIEWPDRPTDMNRACARAREVISLPCNSI